MARNLMPQSGAFAPYVVVNRDAAVTGVFSVDGERGAIDLTSKYLQIVNYNVDKDFVDSSISDLNTAVSDLNTAVSGLNTAVSANTTAIGTKANRGVNSDITSLTTLTSVTSKVNFAISPTVPDAVQPYDAVNLRQLQASSGGSGGASMNGVMNNYIGAVEWFNGTRAKLPAGYVPADGQLLDRADYPDLWTAINSSSLNSTTDSDWLSEAVTNGGMTRRGWFSRGDGSTTFRLPDLNGQSPDGKSIKALFLRGDGYGVATADASIQNYAMIPITGSITMHSNTSQTNVQTASGSFSAGISLTGYRDGGTPNTTSSQSVGLINFDSSKTAGLASPHTSSVEIRPNSAVGIWIIRASGAFTSANTNFSVINADATVPPNGTTVYGGSLKSDYQVGGETYVSAEFRVKDAIGSSSPPSAEITITDNSGTHNFVTYRVGPSRGFIEGLDLNISASGVTVYPGAAVLGTGELVEVMTSITKVLPTYVSSTFFSVYLYSNNGVPDIEISTTAPVKYYGKASAKGSDLSRRFLGYYRITVTSELAECNCVNGFTRFVGPNDGNPLLRILKNATSAVYTQIPITGYIMSGIARSIIFDGTNTEPAGGAVVAYSGASGKTYSTFQSGTNKYEAEVFFNNPSSPQLWYKYSSAPSTGGFYVDVKGFRYDR